MTLEERRLERLRNLLTPLINLPEFILRNEDGHLDDIIKSSAEKSKDLIPLIKEALRSDITLKELNRLYTNPENYRDNEIN